MSKMCLTKIVDLNHKHRSQRPNFDKVETSPLRTLQTKYE